MNSTDSQSRRYDAVLSNAYPSRSSWRTMGSSCPPSRPRPGGSPVLALTRQNRSGFFLDDMCVTSEPAPFAIFGALAVPHRLKRV